tara:strand:- start:92 stop:286 length:195 start_codon:yes stop_codon:yes gene_type:complete
MMDEFLEGIHFDLEFQLNFIGPSKPEPEPKNCWRSNGVYWHAKDEEAAKVIGGKDYYEYHKRVK